MTTAAHRQVEVPAARLGRWCSGFAARHGEPVDVRRDGPALRLDAPDGATATLVPPFPFPSEVTGLAAGLDWVLAGRESAVLLVRRGGYACAIVRTEGPASVGGGTVAPGEVVISKTGSRYVQSRSAAGGWSQRRFARRRANQARDLVRAAADDAVGVLLTGLPAAVDWLVTGGDRSLVDAVLSDARLRPLTALRRGVHLAVPDPRSAVVLTLPARLAAVRIGLDGTEPLPGRSGRRD
jgi:hypothetical protein